MSSTRRMTRAAAAAAAQNLPQPAPSTSLQTPVSSASSRVGTKRRAEVDAMPVEVEEDESEGSGSASPPASKRSVRAKREFMSPPTIPESAPSTSSAVSSDAAATPLPSPPDTVANTDNKVPRVSPTFLSFSPSLLQQPLAAYQDAFDEMAKGILMNYELHSNGHILRLLEIEMYWRAAEDSGPEGGHKDLFAHAHPVQWNNYGNWYWHRQGLRPDTSYKGGNYKGLDMTIGPQDTSQGGGHGGILIRSVQCVSDGRIIEGPCLVADEVLKQHKAPSIVELVSRWNGELSAVDNPTLFFAAAQHSPPVSVGDPVILKSPRVGLTLKQPGASRPRYIMLPYRYTRLVKQKDGDDNASVFNKKNKHLITLSAYHELGSSNSSAIASLCSCTATQLSVWCSAFDAGYKLDSMDSLLSNGKQRDQLATVDGMAKMYGAWCKQYGVKPHKAIIRA